MSTYILISDYKPGVDLVTELWEADGRWMVGELDRGTQSGVVVFRHQSAASLEEVCNRFSVAKTDVMRRKVGKMEGRPTLQVAPGDTAVMSFKEVGWAYPSSDCAREFGCVRTGCFVVKIVSFSVPSGANVCGEHFGPFTTREEAANAAGRRPEVWAPWTKEGGYVSPFVVSKKTAGGVANVSNDAPLPSTPAAVSRKKTVS
jgi:hypothetical protein